MNTKLRMAAMMQWFHAAADEIGCSGVWRDDVHGPQQSRRQQVSPHLLMARRDPVVFTNGPVLYHG